MSQLTFSQDIFLEIQELNRFQNFLSTYKGGYKDMMNNLTYSPGIIKSIKDPNFQNFKIESGTNSQTIKLLQNSVAIDSNFNLIYKEAQDNIPILQDGNWYWVKIGYQVAHVEVGTVSVDANGNLTGISTSFLDVLRGGTDFPVRVKFYNSSNNFQTYEVVSVSNNTNAVLSGSFIAETNLRYSVIGCFTDGFVPDTSVSEIYNYDWCYRFDLTQGVVLETTFNTPPTLNNGLEFFIARVSIQGGNIVIEDKRSQFWQSKADYENTFIDKVNVNTCVGIEDIRFSSLTSPKNENEVNIGWGLRSTNWTINSSLRTLSLVSAIGGTYKDTSSFTTGNFNGWRLYAVNGSYKKIISSVKSGSQINLILDTLDPNDYLLGDQLTIVPDVEEIEFKFIGSIELANQHKSFLISNSVGKIYLELPTASSTYQYTISYRYKKSSYYSSWLLIPDDTTNGYLTEASFDSNTGVLTGTTRLTYTTGIITLTSNPNSFYNFSNLINKGDKKGVQIISSLSTISSIGLTVGSSYNYLLFTGNITLTNNVVINLNTTNIQNGNEFKIQFNCSSFNLNSYQLSLNVTTLSGFTTLKIFNQGDFYQMKNIDNGIIITAISDGTTWYISQNYDLGVPNDVKNLYNVVPLSLFDSVTFMGKVKGLFGYCLANSYSATNYGAPNLSSKFIVAYDPSDSDYSTVGNSGGLKKNNLTVPQLPAHTHTIDGAVYFTQSGGTEHPAGTGGSSSSFNTGSTGTGADIENRPPYFTLIKAYKLF